MGKDLLGEFELMVLLAAMRLGEGDAYALAIVDRPARVGQSCAWGGRRQPGIQGSSFRLCGTPGIMVVIWRSRRADGRGRTHRVLDPRKTRVGDPAGRGATGGVLIHE